MNADGQQSAVDASPDSKGLTVLRVIIYSQLLCSLCTVAFLAGAANGIIQFSLQHRAVLLWLAYVIWLLANVATITATFEFFFAPPLVLLLVCFSRMTWRQRLAGLALAGLAEWATHLALLPWCL